MDSAKKQINPGAYGADTITITSVGTPCDVMTSSTFDFSSMHFDQNTLTSTITSPSISGLSGDYLTNSGWTTASPTMAVNPAGQISLTGDDADIVINGVSLVGKLDAIAERLNLLEVNQELEAEWDQLRELGEQYRQLELDLKAKSAMWKTLKTKTPSKPRS